METNLHFKFNFILCYPHKYVVIIAVLLAGLPSTGRPKVTI